MSFIRTVSQHIPLNTISSQGSGYAEAQARFNEILQTRLGGGVKFNQAVTVTPTQEGDSATKEQIKEQVKEDVRFSSGDSMAAIDSALKGTPMEGLGPAFKAAENTYGVNAYFLTALAAHESDYGKSNIATDKNNLFGFMAYDGSPYASAKGYASVEESIFNTAEYLSKQYLSTEGKHFKGYSIDAIGESYATDPQWAQKVKNHLSKIME